MHHYLTLTEQTHSTSAISRVAEVLGSIFTNTKYTFQTKFPKAKLETMHGTIVADRAVFFTPFSPWKHTYKGHNINAVLKQMRIQIEAEMPFGVLLPRKGKPTPYICAGFVKGKDEWDFVTRIKTNKKCSTRTMTETELYTLPELEVLFVYVYGEEQTWSNVLRKNSMELFE